MNDDTNHPGSTSGSGPGLGFEPAPSIAILISDRQDRPIDEEALAALARVCLAGEGLDRGELSISFVTEEEMSNLRARYLGEEGPTDVLSFEQAPEEDGLLGDVVICPSFAARNADREAADLGSELRLLLVHGILHLLGYDHEAADERKAMWSRQESYTGVRAS